MSGSGEQTIEGTLTLLPNPCTTKPCLPGLAFAVMADDGAPYFLAKNDGFYMHGVPDMPEPGDKVVATGSVQEKRDVTGKAFKAIELTALRSA